MGTRRIRISYFDPDATESDSGDEASPTSSRRSADKTKKIVITVDDMVLAGGGTMGGGGGKRVVRPSPARSSRHRPGVYERQPGRWAAEFRSHTLKVRHWLGTFATEREAQAAYDAFKARLVVSLPAGGGISAPAPAPAHRGDCDGVDRHRAASRPPDERPRVIVQALTATPALVAAASARAAAAPAASSSPPCSPPLPSASPPPLSQNARPRTDVRGSLDWYWDNEPADEDLVGLADLTHLPLPSYLDGKLCDFDSADLSLFDNGFL